MRFPGNPYPPGYIPPPASPILGLIVVGILLFGFGFLAYVSVYEIQSPFVEEINDRE